MDDFEAQRNEMLALASIYDSDCFYSFSDSEENCPYSGTFVADLSITDPYLVKTQDKTHSVNYLPPIVLSFFLPPDYPSQCAPHFTIMSVWLKDSEIRKLSSQLLILWKEREGNEILFVWTSFLRHDSLEFLKITSPIDLPVDIFQVFVDFDENKQRSTYDKGLHSCDICFAMRFGAQSTMFLPCRHIFCNDCIQQDFEVKIRDGYTEKLLCPAYECESRADIKQIRSLVGAETFERYDRLLLQKSLSLMSDVRQCPVKKCGYPVIVDVDSGIGMCPCCKFVFCIYCNKAYHGIAECKRKTEIMKDLLKEYKSTNSAGKERLRRKHGRKQIQDLLDEDASEKWVRDNTKGCPKCKTFIERIDGCNKIYCKKCHANFCWLCLCPISETDPYLHFRNEGTPCYRRLFLDVVPVDDQWFHDEEEFWAAVDDGEFDLGVWNDDDDVNFEQLDAEEEPQL